MKPLIVSLSSSLTNLSPPTKLDAPWAGASVAPSLVDEAFSGIEEENGKKNRIISSV